MCALFSVHVGVFLVVWCMLCAVCSLHAALKKQITMHEDEKKRRTGFAWHLRGSRWSETDPVIICQFSRLSTPRARAAHLDQGPQLHPVFTRASYVPCNREHKKRPAGGRAKNADVQETSIWYLVII